MSTQDQRTHEARAAFSATLQSVGTNLDSSLRDRARTLHDNAAALSKQEDELRRATANLAKQNEQWGKIAQQASEGLKEIGDVQNWAEMIERDLLIVEETLRIVEGGDKDGNGNRNSREGEGDGYGYPPEGGNGNGNGVEEVDEGEGEGERVNGKGKGKATGGWLRWW